MDSVVRIGEPAPDFSLDDLEGREHNLVDVRGKVLVLNFWSSECPHSTRGDETIQELRLGWEGEVVVWSIASNANEKPSEIQEAAAEREVAPLLHDPAQEVADQYGAVTTPQIFVIDRAGVLRYGGALDDTSFKRRSPTRNYLAQAVQAAAEGRDANPAETVPYGCALMRHLVEPAS